jgi:hypothetical protein
MKAWSWDDAADRTRVHNPLGDIDKEGCLDQSRIMRLATRRTKSSRSGTSALAETPPTTPSFVSARVVLRRNARVLTMPGQYDAGGHRSLSHGVGEVVGF